MALSAILRLLQSSKRSEAFLPLVGETPFFFFMDLRAEYDRYLAEQEEEKQLSKKMVEYYMIFDAVVVDGNVFQSFLKEIGVLTYDEFILLKGARDES